MNTFCYKTVHFSSSWICTFFIIHTNMRTSCSVINIQKVTIKRKNIALDNNLFISLESNHIKTTARIAQKYQCISSNASHTNWSACTPASMTYIWEEQVVTGCGLNKILHAWFNLCNLQSCKQRMLVSGDCFYHLLRFAMSIIRLNIQEQHINISPMFSDNTWFITPLFHLTLSIVQSVLNICTGELPLVLLPGFQENPKTWNTPYSQNNMHIKYTSDNGKCPTKLRCHNCTNVCVPVCG
jgi:hypothetical protein